MTTASEPHIAEQEGFDDLRPRDFSGYLFPPADPSTETRMTASAPEPPRCRN